MTERLISADSHVYLSDDVIKSHMSSQASKIWDEARAKDAEYDARVNREGQPQLNIEDFVDLEASQDPGYSNAQARLAAMDRDKVEAEVIFAEVGGARIANPTLMGSHWIDGVRGFNDAMAEFASADPARLLSAYQLPLYDIDLAVAEFDRLAKLGARGIQIPSFPSDAGLPDYHDPVYAKLWSRFEETGITVLNHLEVRPQMWSVFRRDPSPQKGIFTAIPAMSMAETIMFWILAGTLANHPKLKVILVEPGLGWIPWFLSLLDQRMHEHYEFPGLD
ncbi:MAG: amidohydrolase family protein, partial [Halieaceae bacterium]|nr:amidohydrolase family protein [Halieaceae bacterium]